MAINKLLSHCNHINHDCTHHPSLELCLKHICYFELEKLFAMCLQASYSIFMKLIAISDTKQISSLFRKMVN